MSVAIGDYELDPVAVAVPGLGELQVRWRRRPRAMGIRIGKNGQMTDELSVAMTLAFYPRGGSAQVVRYLGRALQQLGTDVTVCCGSLGPPGVASHAATFFDSDEVHIKMAWRWDG